MKRPFHEHYFLRARALTGLLLLLCVFWASRGWSVDSPGLELSLYADKNQYGLGEAIQVIMVLKNMSGELILTEKEFSKVELHRHLKITDPSGTIHSFSVDPWEHDMPAPFFWQDKSWSQTETLLENFVLSETVNDLGDLLPMMRETFGWYTILVQVSFVRYENSETRVHSQIGALGQVDSPNNWEGTIDSNELQVFVSPGLGARFQIQVLEQNGIPLPQIPVKVFHSNDILSGLTLGQAWSDVEPVLVGTTDFKEGLVKTWEGAPCMAQGEYVAVAYYQGDYSSVTLEAVDPGWAPECGAVIQRQVVFGESFVPVPALSTFSVFAMNSVWIKGGAVITSGNIGVQDASPGLWLDSGVEVSIGINARAENGVQVYGDSVKLWWWASIDAVYYNELQNGGTVRGQAVTPLELPLPVALPSFPSITVGKKDVKVGIGKTTTLNPGKYRDVSVGIRGKLRLKQGVYQFRNLNLGASSQLLCMGDGPTEIRIKQRMYPGLKAKIGPAPGSTLTAKDIVFYIEGTNGNLWNLFSYPRAAEIGSLNEVKANMYVPNGTISIDAGSKVQGSFIAQGIVVGIGAQVTLDSTF